MFNFNIAFLSNVNMDSHKEENVTVYFNFLIL